MSHDPEQDDVIPDVMPEADAEADAANADAQPTYTIDGLASASGVPSRTIRFYQSKGALMPPTIVGRVAHYDEGHLERLKLIGQLKDRGLRIRAIADVMARVTTGEVDIGDWLGIEETLREPWSDDAPRLLRKTEMEDALAPFPSGSLAALIEYGLVERREDAYLVQSPGLLDIFGKLYGAGVDIELAADAGHVIEQHLGAMTRELAELFIARAGQGFPETPGDLSKALAIIRKPAVRAVQLIFAKTMQDVLRELIESGRTLTSPGKVKPKRKPRRGRSGRS